VLEFVTAKWVAGIFLEVKDGQRIRLTTSPTFVNGLSGKCGEPWHLATLWASTACYRDSITSLLLLQNRRLLGHILREAIEMLNWVNLAVPLLEPFFAMWHHCMPQHHAQSCHPYSRYETKLSVHFHIASFQPEDGWCSTRWSRTASTYNTAKFESWSCT
jgi:hypothetical protein